VLQRTLDAATTEPSLIVLVRYGLAPPFSLSGVYDTARLDVDGAFGNLALGHTDFDGSGLVTGFAEGDLTLAPGTSGAVTVATTGNIAGAYFITVAIGDTSAARVGQVGPTTSSRVDWIVDLEGASFSSPNGPIEGGGIRLGVRQP